MNIPLTEVVAELYGEEIFRTVVPPGEYEIGREPELQIRLDSDRVSRRHAALTLSYFDWTIEDLGSINGTTIGDRRITEPTKFFPQQRVQVGNVDLKLRRLLATEAGDHLPREMLETLSFVPEKILGQRKYRIRGVIARGSLGVVLEAEDVSTRRRVALKTLLENDSTQAGIRFSEEAQIMAQLEHPNIVRVYESNVNEHDRPFYSMQLAHGDSLKRAIHAIRLQRPASHERWRLDVLLEAFCKACDAMAYAHAKRVVHRDLQPQNILLGEFGEVLVMDWGHAKVLGDRVHGFSAPDTPQFTAPEQLTPEPREIDPRVDVYSLGAILYNLLTLHMPFRASDPAELLEKIGQGKITPPEEAVENQSLPHLPEGKLPARLAAVALKAMSLDPAARHASVPDFQTELRAAAHENGGARGGLFSGLFGRHK